MRTANDPGAVGARETADRVDAHPDSTAAGTASVAANPGEHPPGQIRLRAWRPMHRGNLAGFVSIELSVGLRLFDFPVFTAGTNAPWVSLPRRPRLDRHQKLDANGALEFEPVAEWKDRATADAFCRTVLDQLLAKHPGALDGRIAP